VIEEGTLWLFIAGLAWLPFWYGGNALIAWGVNAILFPGLAVAYEVSLLARRKPHPVGVRHLALPAALFSAVVLWIGFQSLDWGTTSFANPIWGMIAEVLARPVKGSISVNRDLTVMALIRLLTDASAFWLALQLSRDGARAVRLVAAVASIGCGYAVYGLIALKAGHLPWLDIPSEGRLVSATFVNPDSYATYAGLGLVATAGLIVRLYRQEASGAAGGRRVEIATFIGVTGQKGAALLVGGFLLLVTLLLTGSRGGVSAAFLGLGVLWVSAARSPERSGEREPIWIAVFGFLLLAATAIVFGGTIVGKFEAAGISDTSRLAVYFVTLRSIGDAPLLGWGYGTFGDVFPMYRDQSIAVQGTWGQAHSTYLETFQGLGLVFGTMLVASILLLVLRSIKGATSRRQNTIVPCIAASAGSLVAAHAIVDFSLQMQAVAMTFMALLGAGVAQAESSLSLLED
jgi:hypothetical protein